MRFGQLGLGLGMQYAPIKGGGFAIATPTIAVVEPVTNPPSFDIGLPDGNTPSSRDAAEGDYVQLRIDGSTTYTSSALTGTDITNGTIEIANGTLTAGSHNAEARIRRGDGSPGTVYSAWSSIETFTAPSASLSRAYGGSAGSATDQSTPYTLAAGSGLATTGYNLVLVHIRETTGAAVSGVTIDGISAAIVNTADDANGSMVWCLAASSGNASGNIVVTVSDTCLRCAAFWWAISGTPNFTVHASAADTTFTDNGSTVTANLDLNSAANGLVFAGLSRGVSGTYNSAVGVTMDATDALIETMEIDVGSAEISSTETPRTVNITITAASVAELYNATAISLEVA